MTPLHSLTNSCITTTTEKLKQDQVPTFSITPYQSSFYLQWSGSALMVSLNCRPCVSQYWPAKQDVPAGATVAQLFGVTNCFVIELNACHTRLPGITKLFKSLFEEVIGPWRKHTATGSLNECVIKPPSKFSFLYLWTSVHSACSTTPHCRGWW